MPVKPITTHSARHRKVAREAIGHLALLVHPPAEAVLRLVRFIGDRHDVLASAECRPAHGHEFMDGGKDQAAVRHGELFSQLLAGLGAEKGYFVSLQINHLLQDVVPAFLSSGPSASAVRSSPKAQANTPSILPAFQGDTPVCPQVYSSLSLYLPSSSETTAECAFRFANPIAS